MPVDCPTVPHCMTQIPMAWLLPHKDLHKLASSNELVSDCESITIRSLQSARLKHLSEISERETHKGLLRLVMNRSKES